MSSRKFILQCVLLLLYYSATFVCLEPEVQLDFSGNRVVQSGIGYFTAWIEPNIEPDIKVKCKVEHFEGRDLKYTLTIRTEGHNLPIVSENQQLKLVQQVTTVSYHMEFTCHLSVMYTNVNVCFEKQATVTLTVVNEHSVPQCFSNNGTVGLLNEEIGLVCVNCAIGSSNQLMWKNGDIHMETPIPFSNGCQFVTGTKLLEDVSRNETYSCGYEHSDVHVCQLRVNIKRHLLLKIDPPIFNPDQEQFTFTCSSNPPSEVHWNIYTELGDVLRIISQREIYFPNLEKQTQTKINIAYTHGKSTLNLTTTTRVHLVSCWTFRKMFRQVVSTAVPHETDKNCTSMVTNQATLPEDTVECLSQCVPRNTSTSQSFQKCTNERIVYFIIIGGLFVLVIIFGAYLITRLFKKSSCRLASRNTEQNDNLPPMVTNTAYIEYNDANKNQSNSTYQTYNNEGIRSLPYVELNIKSRRQQDETD